MFFSLKCIGRLCEKQKRERHRQRQRERGREEKGEEQPNLLSFHRDIFLSANFSHTNFIPVVTAKSRIRTWSSLTVRWRKEEKEEEKKRHGNSLMSWESEKKKHSVDSQRLSLFALLKRCMLKAYKFVQARSFCEFSLCCSCSYSMISASTLPALWFWRVTEGNVSPSVFTTLVSCQARSAQHYKVNLTTRLWGNYDNHLRKKLQTSHRRSIAAAKSILVAILR